MAEENTATAIDVRFLMAIVSQLSGQPDWQKVADDCGIVTKGAAYVLRVQIHPLPPTTDVECTGASASPASSRSSTSRRRTPERMEPRSTAQRRLQRRRQRRRSHQRSASSKMGRQSLLARTIQSRKRPRYVFVRGLEVRANDLCRTRLLTMAPRGLQQSTTAFCVWRWEIRT